MKDQFLVDSFSQQIFTEYQLYPKFCFRALRIRGRIRQVSFCSQGAYCWGWQNTHKQTDKKIIDSNKYGGGTLGVTSPDYSLLVTCLVVIKHYLVNPLKEECESHFSLELPGCQRHPICVVAPQCVFVRGRKEGRKDRKKGREKGRQGFGKHLINTPSQQWSCIC